MLYIVHGEDDYLVKKQIAVLIKKNNFNDNYDYQRYSLDETHITTIINAIKTINLFAEHKVIVIDDHHNLWEKYLQESSFMQTLLHHHEKVMIIIKFIKNDFTLIHKNANQFHIVKVKNCSKAQLLNLINKVCLSFRITIANDAINWLIENLPHKVNVFLNELNKLRNLNETITLSKVQTLVPKYFVNNIFKMIDYFIKKNYLAFWTEYDYYNLVNCDKIKLVNVFGYQLELISNIKILINQKLNYEAISKKLSISYFQVKLLAQYCDSNLNTNNILLKLHELDYNIKKGKCNKNIAIDLFFLNI